MTTRNNARQAANSVGDNPMIKILARTGFAASALVHVMLGVLAIRVALNGQGQSDQSGALAEIAKLPAGGILLWVVVVGLFALGLWLIVQAVLGIGSHSTKRWVRSLIPAGKAVAYIALGVTAMSFARGGSSNSSDSAQQASASILALPGGPVILAVVGAAAAGIGVYFIYKGASRKFVEDLAVPAGTAGRVVVGAGIVGYIAKGVAIVVAGILFVVAAVTVDPGSATGLDGALKALAALPFGIVILTAVGAGLIAYGLYTFVRARYARL